MKQTNNFSKLSKKLCLSCDKEIYSEYNFGFGPKNEIVWTGVFLKLNKHKGTLKFLMFRWEGK